MAPLTLADIRGPLPLSARSTVSAPPPSAVRIDPSESTKPGGANSTRALPPTGPGRTVIVMQFSSSATALTGARNPAHSFGCCSKAGGVVCSSKNRWSTTTSPSTRFTPKPFRSCTMSQRSAVVSEGSPKPRIASGPDTASPSSRPVSVVS
jgi:hypothetical protein